MGKDYPGQQKGKFRGLSVMKNRIILVTMRRETKVLLGENVKLYQQVKLNFVKIGAILPVELSNLSVIGMRKKRNFLLNGGEEVGIGLNGFLLIHRNYKSPVGKLTIL